MKFIKSTSNSNRTQHKKLKSKSTSDPLSLHHHQQKQQPHHCTCSDSNSNSNQSSTDSTNSIHPLNPRQNRLNRRTNKSNLQSKMNLTKPSTSRILSPLPSNHHHPHHHSNHHHHHHSLTSKFNSIPIQLDQLCDSHLSFSNTTRTNPTPLDPHHSSNNLQLSTRKRKRRSPNENHHHSLENQQSIGLPTHLRSKPQTSSQAPSSSALDPSLESSYQQEDDDQFYLNLATKTQLSRLKRNHLFNLTHHLISSSPSTTTHSIDHEALTKDALISLILDSRSSKTKLASSSTKSDPIERPIASIPRRQSVRTNTHHSGPTHSRSPRQMIRTKSLPHHMMNSNTHQRSSRSSQRSIGLKRKSDEDEERDELGGSSDDSDDRRRESDRKVKFGDPHTTPIVHRTRATTTHTSTHSNHDSNSKEPIIGRLTRSKSKSALTTELVINPSPKSARKLRNGKVIRKDFLGKKHDSRNSNSNRGESEEEEGSADDELENESELEEEEEEEEEEEDLGEASVKASSVEENEDEEENGEDGNEDEDEDEEQEEEVNLADATSKRLLRLKRDNLIKLCEERELEVEGTKKELVQHLLKWRNTNENDGFSQSSDLYPSFEDEDEADNDESVIGSQANQQVESSSSEVEVNVNEEDEEEEEVEEEEEEEEKDELSETPILIRSNHSNPTKSSDTKLSKKPSRLNQHTKKDEIGELLDLESLNLQDKEIQADQLKKLEMIGSGGFKDVYKGIYKRVPVAIADIRGHLTEMDLKELRILRDLRHENIVRFIGVSVPEDSRNVPMMIVTEICTNGDLFDYIRSVPSPGLMKICGMMKDISKGLNYLHTRNPVIIHRDLKSSNVLITSRGVAKLNDFGLARIKNSTRSMVKSLVGTVNWQAPELWVAHPRYNEKVDVYSAGLVLWEMLQWHQPIKRYPFEGQNEHAIYQDVGQRQLRPSTAGMRRHWGDEIVNLIESLWNQNPNDRMNMKETIKRIDEILENERNHKR